MIGTRVPKMVPIIFQVFEVSGSDPAGSCWELYFGRGLFEPGEYTVRPSDADLAVYCDFRGEVFSLRSLLFDNPPVAITAKQGGADVPLSDLDPYDDASPGVDITSQPLEIE